MKTPDPVLLGSRCSLLPAGADKRHPLAVTLAADPVTSQWLGTDSDALHRWLTGEGVHVFEISAQGSAAGVITFEEELDPDYRHANIDIALFGEYVAQGIGSDAIRVLAGWLFSMRGHHRLTIDPAADNARAIRAYRRVGYRPIGIMRAYERGSDGTWHDSLLMDMLADELTATPLTD